jgi:hypothetical protein
MPGFFVCNCVFLLQSNFMKGVNYITDDKNRRKAVIIELKTIEQHQEGIEDFLDIIIAESRKDEPKRTWEEVKKTLKKKGKL